MADQLSRLQEPEASPHKWPHDWHSYEDYLTVHERHMQTLMDEGLVLRSRLSRIEIGGKKLQKVQIRGRVECARDVVIVVDKWLEARYNHRNQCEVRGFSYSYEACLRGGRQLVRYDSAHGLDRLHRHTYDPRTGKEIDEQPIALGDLPSLSDFIREGVQASRG